MLKVTFQLLLFSLTLLFTSCQKDFVSVDYTNSIFYQEYNDLISSLNPDFPGNGIDIFNNQEKNRPMAYGLLMSAEQNRYLHTRDNEAYLFVKKCGKWLMENSDLNNNNIIGFGLADEWDAFNDGSINEIHHEYTITTALVVKGLLDWYDIENDQDLKFEIENFVSECLSPFLDDRYDSPIGIPSYSFSPTDTIYDVYNPAAYLAGQLKRFSNITEDINLKETLSLKSNAIIEVLEQNVKLDNQSNFCWDHSIQHQKKQDLLHACYVVEGIRDFKNAGGSINLNFSLIHNHLYSFNTDSVWFEFLQKELMQEERLRLWSIGMLIYSLSAHNDFIEIEQSISEQLLKFYVSPGQYRFRIDDDRNLIRQKAHLILGLSYYIYNNDRFKVN